MNSKLIAIVPAAGVGTRAETTVPKQYQPVRGQPMLRLAVSALLADARIYQVRVAVAQGDDRVAEALHGLPRTVWRACGGPTRAATVAAALADAQLADNDWVLVHDAARPGLPADALARLITTCLDTGRGGLLALPVADTVKHERRMSYSAMHGPDEALATDSRLTPGSVRNDGPASRPGIIRAADGAAISVVQASVPREGLWLAQTPQMFPAGLLGRALAVATQAGHDITDEASAVEFVGHAPLLVRGSMRNFKVTWPEDVDLMAKWL